MIFTETILRGSFIIELERIEDERGFFSRTWCAEEIEEHGLKSYICQENISFNRLKGTLRGMHFQKEPYQETKLIRCSHGSIYDVIIDLRKDSPTYKQWLGVKLSEGNYKMLYIPENFAHGFITLENNSQVTYIITQFYNPSAESGIRWDDLSFNIKWPMEPVVISEKDRSYPDCHL